jgi:hypothetical protein
MKKPHKKKAAPRWKFKTPRRIEGGLLTLYTSATWWLIPKGQSKVKLFVSLPNLVTINGNAVIVTTWAREYTEAGVVEGSDYAVLMNHSGEPQRVFVFAQHVHSLVA